MADVTFFHNERSDGGRRTGVTVDGVRALDHFVPGGGERDPTLVWYVDVVCETPTPPTTQEDAADWLASHAGAVRESLAEAADRLTAGVDADGAPWDFERSGPDGPIRVAVSARRSRTGHEVGRRIRDLLASDWVGAVAAAKLTPVGG